MSKLIFSIVIPAYNRASYIGNAIQSILEQTYSNFEVIVIDDGSTDNTKEVVLSFEDDRIKYFYKENEERNIARNYGMSKAVGQYVNFLDSDDVFLPHHLQTAKAFINEKSNPEVIHLNYENQGTKVTPSLINKNNAHRVNQLLIQENMCVCNCLFVRIDITRDYQFLASKNAIVGEDHYYFLFLASRYIIHTNPRVSSRVVEHPGRSLRQIDVDKLVIGMTEIYDALSADNVFTSYYGWRAKRYFAYNFIFTALQLIMVNKKKEAFQFLLKSIGIFPLSIFSVRFIAVLKKTIF